MNKQRVSYACLDHQDSLIKAFSVRVQEDMDTVHPVRFCMRCNSMMRKKLKSMEERKPYLQSTIIFEWAKHELDCKTCNHFNILQKGGRPKKGTKNRGKPSENSRYQLIKHIQQISPVTFYSDDMIYTSINVRIPAFLNIQSHDFECWICLGILNGPVRLSCGSFVCSICLIKSIEGA